MVVKWTFKPVANFGKHPLICSHRYIMQGAFDLLFQRVGRVLLELLTGMSRRFHELMLQKEAQGPEAPTA